MLYGIISHLQLHVSTLLSVCLLVHSVI